MTDPRASVFLVGFMGCGKTTIGRALADLLGWSFVDLDELIVGAERRSIPQIFREEGGPYYRRLERQILASLSASSRLVVACGGGTYAQEEGRALINSMGRAVWLRVPLALALSRCDSGPARPMLKDTAQAEALYRARLPAYRSAPLRLDIEGLSPERAAEQIAVLL